MYSLPSYQTQGLWPASAHLADAHSRWLTSEALLTSRCAGQARRPLTPPQDMNSLAPTYRSYESNYQEPGRYSGERHPSSKSYLSQYDSATESSEMQKASSQQYTKAYTQTSSSRQSSPSLSQQSFSATSQTRKGSQQSLIAPSLQIPNTINNSRGSLSDLAAQITCLFWFESSAVLDYAEGLDSTATIPQSLCSETIPTTGFRKWVTTILSTTQVAQNVILLALLFIYRLKRQNPSVRGKPGSEYRLLTVALMLGNKFLDDNTYTNKTWAEVSGISVMEVHIMEVEFLSNMKYNLFTSAAQWSTWQNQLGQFARFLEQATQSPKPQAAPALPLGQYSGSTLPSPPISFQASPPRTFTPAMVNQQRVTTGVSQMLQASSARPSPYKTTSNLASGSRKRGFEDDEEELANSAKRVMYNQPQYTRRLSQNDGSSMSRMYDLPQQQHAPSTTSVYQAMGQTRASVQSSQRENYVPPHLPPLSQQLKPSPASWQSTPISLAANSSSLAMALQSARTSRNQSPYLSSTNVSPTNTALLPATPQNGQSPSVFLAQRDSPYKPVRGVHTLLVPPPSRAMNQADHVRNNQMHYQPLGRPFNERQAGKLPYIALNQWFDGMQKASIPLEQWQNTAYNPNPNQHIR
ncbi:hypothetical protein ANO11243_086450 [Dothideomycetidae sp. 11243]|nr:hypothetical protein ANO11243_086450 [fungal sp. No.11243]